MTMIRRYVLLSFGLAEHAVFKALTVQWSLLVLQMEQFWNRAMRLADSLITSKGKGGPPQGKGGPGRVSGKGGTPIGKGKGVPSGMSGKGRTLKGKGKAPKGKGGAILS